MNTEELPSFFSYMTLRQEL